MQKEIILALLVKCILDKYCNVDVNNHRMIFEMIAYLASKVIDMGD